MSDSNQTVEQNSVEARADSALPIVCQYSCCLVYQNSGSGPTAFQRLWSVGSATYKPTFTLISSSNLYRYVGVYFLSRQMATYQSLFRFMKTISLSSFSKYKGVSSSSCSHDISDLFRLIAKVAITGVISYSLTNLFSLRVVNWLPGFGQNDNVVRFTVEVLLFKLLVIQIELVHFLNLRGLH